MAHYLTLHLHRPADDPPKCYPVPSSTGETFLAFSPCDDITLFLVGYDHETIAHARQLAHVLTEAANALERDLADRQTAQTARERAQLDDMELPRKATS